MTSDCAEGTCRHRAALGGSERSPAQGPEDRSTTHVNTRNISPRGQVTLPQKKYRITLTPKILALSPRESPTPSEGPGPLAEAMGGVLSAPESSDVLLKATHSLLRKTARGCRKFHGIQWTPFRLVPRPPHAPRVKQP